jgi:hypothetical protein
MPRSRRSRTRTARSLPNAWQARRRLPPTTTRRPVRLPLRACRPGPAVREDDVEGGQPPDLLTRRHPAPPEEPDQGLPAGRAATGDEVVHRRARDRRAGIATATSHAVQRPAARSHQRAQPTRKLGRCSGTGGVRGDRQRGRAHQPRPSHPALAPVRPPLRDRVRPPNAKQERSCARVSDDPSRLPALPRPHPPPACAFAHSAARGCHRLGCWVARAGGAGVSVGADRAGPGFGWRRPGRAGVRVAPTGQGRGWGCWVAWAGRGRGLGGRVARAGGSDVGV